MMHDINDLHVGGFITITHGSPLGIIKSQAYPTAVLTNQLQSKSKLPLLIGADFERGAAMRLDEGTSFPTAMALAAAGNPKDAYTMGKITALEARAVGHSMDLRAGGRREQQSRQPHHQHALVWRRSRAVSEYVASLFAACKKMAASPPQNISPGTATPPRIRTSIFL